MMADVELHPLADITADPAIAALPKADLHVHAEAEARFERVLERRGGRTPRDRRIWAAHMMRAVPAGMARLMALDGDRVYDRERVEELDTEQDLVIARIADVLEEGAADGALLIEVIFGAATILVPGFMALFREAERQVRQRFPGLRAEALIASSKPGGPEWLERFLPACIAAAREGLAGINIIPQPYDAEIDWAPIYRWAPEASAAGLGLAAHAAEFGVEHLGGALGVPGLARIGHAVYAGHSPRLLEQLARSGVTVECSLTCNVVLGAVESYAGHPIRQLAAAGVPVTLSSDDPVRVATTIGREYAVAARLGFTERELLGFTANAVRASFTSEGRRVDLLAELARYGSA
jgi:adenosine deaminase